MVGFVFLDAGYDLSNSCVKTFVLAASPQAHHVSLLVLGVLMSAVGGCVTALTGLFDLGSILTQGTSLDPVVAQALLQASFIVTLALVCTLCTLVSGHASSTTPGHVHDIAIPNPSSSGRDIEQSIIASFGTLHTDVQENVIMATTSPYEAFSATPTANPDRQVFLFPENADSAETFLKSAPRAPAPASEPGQSVKLDTMASSPGANKHLMTYLATSQPRDVDGPGDETAETMADEGNDLMVTSFMDTDVLLEKKSKEKKHRKQRPTPVQCRRIDDIMKMATSKMKENGEATTQAFEFTSSSAIRKAESVSRKDSQVAHSDSNSATDSDGETKRLIKNDRSGLCPGGAACHSKRCPELRCCGRLDRNKRNLVLICLASFFMAGSVQSYNLCVTDYVGKVIFSGDPEADPGSQSYAAYQEGLRAGSLGMLFLNSAYILFNLVHRKILNCFGPKTELLVFSTVQAKSLTGAGKVKVGTTMALVTSMMPLAYVVTCRCADVQFTSRRHHRRRKIELARQLYKSITATADALVDQHPR
nr:hypothetical protein BaRGS_003846 [Batillaria attramentaria]